MMDFTPKQDDQNIRAILLQKTVDLKADLIIIGYHGRKGPKK